MVNADALDRFLDLLVGESNNLKTDNDCAPYEKGWRYGDGKALRVVRPGSVEEVASLLNYCNEHHIAVIPQGGNTGLVGASVPDDSGTQLVLSTSRLNQKININEKEKTVTVSAGVVLDKLNEILESHDLWLPIDISSSGTAQIGGLIATNAAGTRRGRYGDTKSRLRSLVVALANGQVETIDCEPTISANRDELLQDNSFIDKYHHFCGSEGWLGIIVEATFALEPLPRGKATGLLVPTSPAHTDLLVARILEDVGEDVSALEGMADRALHLVAAHIPKSPYLFLGDELKTDEQDYVLLVELASAHEDNDTMQEKLENLLAYYFEEGLIATARTDKPAAFWHVRHSISEAIAREGKVIAFDIATPKGKLTEFRARMTKELKETWPFIDVIPFGHEMISACHYNIIWPYDAPEPLDNKIRNILRDRVYHMLVGEYKGTFSAEHGIGPHNQRYYDHYATQAQKALAATLKARYDANRILNPTLHFD